MYNGLIRCVRGRDVRVRDAASNQMYASRAASRTRGKNVTAQGFLAAMQLPNGFTPEDDDRSYTLLHTRSYSCSLRDECDAADLE